MGDYNKSRKETRKIAKARYKKYKKNQGFNKWLLILISIVVIIFVGLLCIYVWEEEKIEEEQDVMTLEKTEDSTVESEVEDAVSSMNLETRIGQLFITSPEELTGIGIAVQAGETTKQKLKEYAVGGLIFGDQNFEVLDQMKLMLNSIESYTKTPIFLAMDEVGALRITNMKYTLSEVGFDLSYTENELYLTRGEEETPISDFLDVVIIEEQDIVEVINEGAELLIVLEDFTEYYDEVVAAVRSGEIEESVIEERVRAIMTYKIENGI